VNYLVTKLDELMSIYNDCKDYRHLLAHSPMFVNVYENTKSGQLHTEYKVVNSRRIKKNSKNSVAIKVIEDLNHKFAQKSGEIFNVLSDIIVYCHPMYQIKEAKRERL
jgi:hypothetical protein